MDEAKSTGPNDHLVQLAGALLEKKVLELREGALPLELATAIEKAIKSTEDKTDRVDAIMEVFDSELVDEIYLDDDELRQLAKQLARQFG